MKKLFSIWVFVLALFSAIQLSAAPLSAPERSEGEGPFKKLILRGVTLINGEGAPPRGPVDIVIENNRITKIQSVGNPGVPIKANRPKAGPNDKFSNLKVIMSYQVLSICTRISVAVIR